jgi:hypothetical protein
MSTLLPLAVWACLLIVFMVARPSPRSTSFWMLIGCAIASGGVYMVLSTRESRRTQRETLLWSRKVDTLVDVHDHEDDGHLYEYLDDSERRRIMEELERMPAGSRSLRRAIRIVSPELTKRQG